jgi:hypothetical protein
MNGTADDLQGNGLFASDDKLHVGEGVGILVETNSVSVITMDAMSDLSQTISDPPTQTEVAALQTAFNDLLASLRTQGILQP